MKDRNIKAHESYLRLHERQHPFPLDGSDWSRLVQMRLDREYHRNDCKCHKCENFLTELHSLYTPLAHEHTALPRALGYWFMHEVDLSKLKPLFHTEDTAMEAAMKNLSDTSNKAPEGDMTAQNVTLQQVEADWLKRRIKAWGPLPGKFWIPDTAEEKEAHPEGKAADKRKLMNERAKEDPTDTEAELDETKSAEVA